jgi:hypothetical protein
LSDELVACRSTGLLAPLAWIHSSASIVVITTHFLQSPEANIMCVKSVLCQLVLHALVLREELRLVATRFVVYE